MGRLGSHSFATHEALAHQFGKQRLEDRRLSAYTANVNETAGSGAKDTKEQNLEWLDGGVSISSVSRIGDSFNCAQVTPKLLIDAILDEAHEREGTNIALATVTCVSHRDGGDCWAVTATSTDKTGAGGGNNYSSNTCCGPSQGAVGWNSQGLASERAANDPSQSSCRRCTGRIRRRQLSSYLLTYSEIEIRV